MNIFNQQLITIYKFNCQYRYQIVNERRLPNFNKKTIIIQLSSSVYKKNLKSRRIFLLKIEQANKTKIENSYDKIDSLSAEINQKFKYGKYKTDQQFKVKKFQKDFEKNFGIYIKLLQKRNRAKQNQVLNLRKSSAAFRQSLLDKKKTKKSKNNDSDQDDYHTRQIQLQQVNQQTLFFEHMIQLKQKQLLEVKKKMEDALNVQKQVGRLVHQQGQKLDLAEANIDITRSNVKDAEQMLEQAKKDHISANKKKFCIAGIIFIILLIIIIPIIVTQAS